MTRLEELERRVADLENLVRLVLWACVAGVVGWFVLFVGITLGGGS